MEAIADFDVIVAGGGPAGSAAAITLARGGCKVALLDKAAFPRHKLCGGLISLRCRKALEEVFGPECDPPVEAKARGAKVFFRERFLNDVLDYKALSFVSRIDFDHYLLGLARAQGVHVFEDASVQSLSADHKSIVTRDGRCFNAPFIVGADGASSHVRKELRADIDKRGFAVGLEMEVPRSFVARAIEVPEIYLGVVRWGYAWIFPKAHTLTVGVGGLSSENGDMREAFDAFARMAIGSVPDLPLLRHPIPFGNFLVRPGEQSVLLAGDAAGLVEPITGEGIAFAILSGHHAAQAVLEARAASSSDALSFYEKRYRDIVRLFDDGKWLRYLMFTRAGEPLFVRTLAASSGGLIRKHMDVIAGDADYRDYARYLASAAWKLPRLFFPSTAKAR
jgi:geranylgeranyl reductase family protein